MSFGFWVKIKYMKKVLSDKIDDRTFEFALKIVRAYKFLVDRKIQRKNP